MEKNAIPSIDIDKLVEGVAHSLVQGTSDSDILASIKAAGVFSVDAVQLLQDIKESPLLPTAIRIARDLRNWEDLTDTLFSLESSGYDFKKIPRICGISSEEFHENFYSLNRPVIITDVISTWPAFKKWILGFLREQFGSERIRYQSGRSANDHSDAFVDLGTEANLAEYIDLIDSDDPSGEHYLIAHDRILSRPSFASLLDDIHLDARYFDATKIGEEVSLWLGPAGSLTPMHRDLSNVYFAQIFGRKRVKLIPSRQSHRVYAETGFYSEIDFEAPDYDRFPQLRNLCLVDEVIEAGELLFIPVGWWHHVKALEVSATVTGTNFCFPNNFSLEY